jgi:hypothetical protein
MCGSAGVDGRQSGGLPGAPRPPGGMQSAAIPMHNTRDMASNAHTHRADEKIRKNIDTRAKIIPKTFFESSQVYGMQRDKNAKKCFEKQLTQAGEGVWLCL